MHPMSQIGANGFAFHLTLYVGVFCKKIIPATLKKIVKLDIETFSHEMCNNSGFSSSTCKK